MTNALPTILHRNLVFPSEVWQELDKVSAGFKADLLTQLSIAQSQPQAEAHRATFNTASVVLEGPDRDSVLLPVERTAGQLARQH